MPTGKVLTIFENGLSSWVTLSNKVTIDDPISIVSFLMGLAYLIYTDIGMLPIALGYMIVMVMFSLYIQKKSKPYMQERRKAKEDG